MLLAAWLNPLWPVSPRTSAMRRRNRPPGSRRPRIEMLERRHLLANGAGYLLVPSKDTDNVLRYDAATGAFVDEFVRHKSGGLNQPTGAIFGPLDHNLYVSSGFYGGPGQHKAVLRYNGTTGKFMDEFTEPGHLEKVNQLLFGPDANEDGRQDLYVSNGIEFGPGMVVRFDGVTGTFIDSFVPPSDRLRGPRGMVFGPSLENPTQLNLYLASGFSGVVSRFDARTGAFLGEIDPASAGLGYAVGVTFGPDGNLYVAVSNYDPPHAYGGPNGVLRYQGPSGESPGTLIDVFVTPGSGGLLDPLGGVPFGPDGNGDGHQDLYVSNAQWASSYETKEHTSTVKRYDGVSGAFIDTFVKSDSGGLSGPWLMTFDKTDPMTLAYRGGRQQPSTAASLTSAAQDSVNQIERRGIGSGGFRSLPILAAPVALPMAASDTSAATFDKALGQILNDKRTTHFSSSTDLDCNLDLLVDLTLTSELTRPIAHWTQRSIQIDTNTQTKTHMGSRLPD